MDIRRVVQKVIGKYGNDIYEIVSRLNVKVLEAKLPERLPEIFFGDYIVLKSDLPRERKIHYLAHALGHYFLHKEGNFLLFYWGRMRGEGLSGKLTSLPGGC
jgi:Zn-dependent peptidase ImmA (M78 family)